MRIVFLIATLGRGGAERVAVTLANQWTKDGHEVHLVTLDRDGDKAAYCLRESIGISNLALAGTSRGLVGAVSANIRRMRVLKRIVKKLRPDVVVSFMLEMNVLIALASVGESWPLVISERIHPQHHPVGVAWDLLRRWFYGRADAVVAQTQDIATWLRRATGARVYVIPNPIDRTAFQLANGVSRRPRKTLLSVGRLHRQKGHDIAIEAFAGAELPEWDMIIAGDGPERQSLERKIVSLGMQKRISLIGEFVDVASLYAAADAVVHGARYEGYPNVVLEALAAGKPIISTDAPGATRELLENGRYGVLVPPDDTSALANAMRTTLSDKEKLASLARSAADRATENDVVRIAPVWIDLFSKVIGERQ